MADSKEIMELALKLNLMNIANGVIDLNDEKMSNKEYLYTILKKEYEIRHANRLREMHKSSKLPKRTFYHDGINKGLEWQIDKIKQSDFIHSHQNIIIVGDCSSGKTSLAVELGNAMIDKGTDVFYLRYDDYILAVKSKNKNWTKLLNTDVVILDDFFYVRPDDEELLLVYRSLMFLMESRSLILITNRKLSEWNEMNADKHLMETLQKRITQDAQLISLQSTGK